MTKAHRMTDEESATPHDQTPQMDAAGHYVPKDFYDLYNDQRTKVLEALTVAELLLTRHHVDTGSFLRFAKDLDIFLKVFKDLDYEFDNLQTDHERQDDLERIIDGSSNVFEFTRSMYEHVSNKVDQAQRIVETRRQMALDWARRSWPKAKGNELELSTMGLSSLTNNELKTLYHATRRISSFQERFGFDDNELNDLFKMGDNLRAINREYEENTRREVEAMELLKLFRPSD